MEDWSLPQTNVAGRSREGVRLSQAEAPKRAVPASRTAIALFMPAIISDAGDIGKRPEAAPIRFMRLIGYNDLKENRE
jgi:hypothetical protein